MRWFTTIISVLLAVIVCSTTFAKRQKPEKNKIPHEYASKPNKFHFGGDAGAFSGESANMFLDLKDQFTSRIYYGYFGQYTHLISPSIGLGVQYKKLFKEVPNYDLPNPRGDLFSVFGNYYFSTNKKNSYYLHLEIGQIKIKVPEYPSVSINISTLKSAHASSYDGLEFDWKYFFTFGLGIYSKTTNTTSTIIEIYYQQIFLGDDAYPTAIDKFDIQMIGLTFGFGFQL